MNPDHHSTQRKRWRQISEAERYKIEGMLEAGHTTSEIGRLLGRDRRTIQREIKRGTVLQRRTNRYVSRNPEVPDYVDQPVYKADAGQRMQQERASNKGRGLKIGHDHKLASYLERQIANEGYSPDAALGKIRNEGMHFDVSLCTKTVYNMIDRGDFLRLSNAHLPIKRNKKKRGYRRTHKIGLKNKTGRRIEDRPVAAQERREQGHWEMDLVVGSGKACLLVMTERVSRKEVLMKLPDKRQESVIRAIDRLERRHRGKFAERFKSLTTDNGSEFLDSEGLEASCLQAGKKRTTCYYAHPYSAWERGSNENANKLIRRFIPKGTDIGQLTHGDIRRIEHWMNNYPRRLLAYRTAQQVYSAA